MKHTRTGYVILGILSIQSNISGYDIRKGIEGSVGYFWGESYGQIYPTLKELTAEGLITASEPPAGTRQGRLLYALTKTGRAALREWLSLPFQNDRPRNEFLIKLFFGREAPRTVSIGHILELQARNQQAIETLEGLKEIAHTRGAHNPHRLYWELTLSFGIALTSAALDWCEEMLGGLPAAEVEECIKARETEAREAEKHAPKKRKRKERAPLP